MLPSGGPSGSGNAGSGIPFPSSSPKLQASSAGRASMASIESFISRGPLVNSMQPPSSYERRSARGSFEEAEQQQEMRGSPASNPQVASLPGIKHLLGLERADNVGIMLPPLAGRQTPPEHGAMLHFPSASAGPSETPPSWGPQRKRNTSTSSSQGSRLGSSHGLSPMGKAQYRPRTGSSVGAGYQGSVGAASPLSHTVSLSDPSPMFLQAPEGAYRHAEGSASGDRTSGREPRTGKRPISQADGGMAAMSAARRRHTVGAPDEPLSLSIEEPPPMPRLAPGSYATPRPTLGQQQAMYAPNPDSPTTPTARRYGSDAVPALVYQQSGGDMYTGSMPSLSSSISSASLSSDQDRNRVWSLEGRSHHGQGRHPAGPHNLSWSSSRSSDVASSSSASGWHSRSSTQDSVDSVLQPFPPSRTSSIQSDSSVPEAVRLGSAGSESFRQRHQSLMNQGQPQFMYNTANEEEEAAALNRPRAQTLNAPHRPIAPLPGAAQQQQHGSLRHRRQPPQQQQQQPAPPPAAYQHMRGHAHQSYPGSRASTIMDVDEDPRSTVMQRSHSQEEALRMPDQAHLAAEQPQLTMQTGSTRRSEASSSGPPLKYECPWCPKAFTRPSSLRIHNHVHTGEKPFACLEPGCGRSFSVQSNLRRHQKGHHQSGDSNDEGGRGGRSAGRSDSVSSHTSQRQEYPMGTPSVLSSATTSPSNGPVSLVPQQQRAHPPLSRSAYEPGSRAYSSPWPTQQQYHASPYDTHGVQRFQNARERRTSGSSGEDDEFYGGSRHTIRPMPGAGSSSVLSDGDSEDMTVVQRTPPASSVSIRRDSSTSGVRRGFASLLNSVDGP